MIEAIGQISAFLQNWTTGAVDLAFLAGAALSGLVLHYLIFRCLSRINTQGTGHLNNALVEHCNGPSKLLIPLLLIRLCMPLIEATPGVSDFMYQILGIFLILSISWLLIRLTLVAEDLILNRFDTEAKDNLRARKVHTQIGILRRIAIAIVTVFAFASILMSFSNVRQLGTSILASAGVISIILGFAAQRSIATLFAGFQVALTQPIRLDDVVIVENEWGRIEEITLTYVVVRIWDMRRLIVPVNYFLENPFQNWTRVSANLLGSVYIYVDYTVPVQELRSELLRILKSSDYWDGKVCVLHVTNSTERTLELRALMSKPDSSSGWELRCHVREKLVEFMKEKHPEALPVFRTELNAHSPAPSPQRQARLEPES